MPAGRSSMTSAATGSQRADLGTHRRTARPHRTRFLRSDMSRRTSAATAGSSRGGIGTSEVSAGGDRVVARSPRRIGSDGADVRRLRTLLTRGHVELDPRRTMRTRTTPSPGAPSLHAGCPASRALRVGKLMWRDFGATGRAGFDPAAPAKCMAPMRGCRHSFGVRAGSRVSAGLAAM
jgi:hypothetical protein